MRWGGSMFVVVSVKVLGTFFAGCGLVPVGLPLAFLW